MPESPEVLARGEWVQRGAVRVWQETPPPEQGLTPADVAQMTACPVCLVKVCQSCKTSGGYHRAPHSARRVSRTCHCGAAVVGSRTYCEDCRVEARRATWRRYMAQRRLSTGSVDNALPLTDGLPKDDGPEMQEAA